MYSLSCVVSHRDYIVSRKQPFFRKWSIRHANEKRTELAKGERRLGESRRWQTGEGKGRGREGRKVGRQKAAEVRTGERRGGAEAWQGWEQWSRGDSRSMTTKVSVSPRSVWRRLCPLPVSGAFPMLPEKSSWCFLKVTRLRVGSKDMPQCCSNGTELASAFCLDSETFLKPLNHFSFHVWTLPWQCYWVCILVTSHGSSEEKIASCTCKHCVEPRSPSRGCLNRLQTTVTEIHGPTFIQVWISSFVQLIVI